MSPPEDNVDVAGLLSEAGIASNGHRPAPNEPEPYPDGLLDDEGTGAPNGNGGESAVDPELLGIVKAELGLKAADALRVADRLAERITYEQVVDLARRVTRDRRAVAEADFAGLEAGTADKLLAIERPTRRTVLGDLLQEGHNATVVARWKVGKSTFVENVAAACVSGGYFLARFPVPEPLRVMFLNYELDGEDMDARIRRLKLTDEQLERLYVINLRGRRMPLQAPAGRDEMVRRLVDHGTDVVIVDPFGAAYASAGGSDENHTGEVRRFLLALDEVKALAGVRTLLMPVHTGRGEHAEGEERSRGATTLDDWPDVIMFLTRDASGARYLRTDGRAPFRLPESRLGFDEHAGRLMLATDDMGLNRRQAKSRDNANAVAKAVRDEPGLNARGLREALALAVPNNEDKAKAIAQALADRHIHQHAGKGVAKLHHPGAPHLDDEPCPGGWTP